MTARLASRNRTLCRQKKGAVTDRAYNGDHLGEAANQANARTGSCVIREITFCVTKRDAICHSEGRWPRETIDSSFGRTWLFVCKAYPGYWVEQFLSSAP